MALPTPTTTSSQPRRVWRAPAARTRWFWLAFAAVLYAVILVWYISAVRTQPFVGPFADPLRLFGVIAFLLVLGVAAYTLRRRFVRSLPGMARDWLEAHIWLGIAAILIVYLHENFGFLHGINLGGLTNEDWGPLASLALTILVLSGIAGKLLDGWEARTIAAEASSNGVGIVQAVEERLLQLEYTVERLSAGKSEPFKQYCLAALEGNALPATQPTLPKREEQDFQRASATLAEHAKLAQSLQRQKQARQFMRYWRYVHMVIATLALIAILYHSIAEIFTSILHL
jgi:hypothetical protein